MNQEEQWNEHKQHTKAALYEKSKARFQHWPNTIDAIRKKKDDDKIRKLEEQEIERRKTGKSLTFMRVFSFQELTLHR
jgi:uncharacterized membrane protein (DUF106 family)